MKKGKQSSSRPSIQSNWAEAFISATGAIERAHIIFYKLFANQYKQL